MRRETSLKVGFPSSLDKSSFIDSAFGPILIFSNYSLNFLQKNLILLYRIAWNSWNSEINLKLGIVSVGTLFPITYFALLVHRFDLHILFSFQ